MTTKEMIAALSALPQNAEVLLYDPTEDQVLGTPEVMPMVQAEDGSLWRSREEMSDMEGVTPKADVVAVRIAGENPLHL
jgi:hypothetical protein